MESKKFVKIVGIVTIVVLIGCSLIIAVIDPYFHFHKPLDSLAYIIDNERYQNNGIVRNFDYDTIITGTSMTENFKTSECDSLFGCNSIKVPLNGAHFNEVDRQLNVALKLNPDIKIVFRSIDYSMMDEDKDIKRLGEENFPTYLYDDNYANDVNYLLNKTILFKCGEDILYTAKGGTTTTFDEYVNWSNAYCYGKEEVLKDFERPVRKNEIVELSEEKRQMVSDNIYQNVEKTIEENPEVTFYLFFPPYSILFWDSCNQEGMVHYRIGVEREVIERLLTHENVRLFSFTNNFDLVCNLDNYKDAGHYGEWINSEMLQWMKVGEYELTSDNYEDYLEEIEDFYLNYDYDSIYEE